MECGADLIDEFREVTHVYEFATKHRAAIRYISKVKPREMQEGDLVLRQVVLPTQQGKL